MPTEKQLTDEDLDNILQLLDEDVAFDKLTNRELSAMVLHHVWAKKLVFGSHEERLLDKYITRFEKLAGIERDEDGIMLPEKTK